MFLSHRRRVICRSLCTAALATVARAEKDVNRFARGNMHGALLPWCRRGAVKLMRCFPGAGGVRSGSVIIHC